MTSFVVRDDAPAEDVARARHRRQAPGHQAARARLCRPQGQPGVATALEHELLYRALVAPEDVLLERGEELALEHVRTLLRPGLGHEVHVDLEVAGADRHLDPVAVAARVVERTSRPPTR